MTTGDMENGRSRSVMRAERPQNLRLAMTMAIDTPKTVLMGTAMPASMRVSLTCGISKISDVIRCDCDWWDLQPGELQSCC